MDVSGATPGARVRSAGRRRTRRTALAGSLLLAAGLVAGGAPASAAAPNVTFFMRLGDCGVGGQSDPEATFEVVVTDRLDRRLLEEEVTANKSGTWRASCLPRNLRTGDRVTALVGGVLHRLLVIPEVWARVDRAANIVSGRAPAGDSVAFELDTCYPGGILKCTGNALAFTVVADGGGEFEVDLGPGGPHDIKGGDSTRLMWESASGDTLFWNQTVPYLEAFAGKARVRGAGASGDTYDLTLRDGQGRKRGAATATPEFPYGGWETILRGPDGRARVRAGDRLRGSFATDALVIVRPPRIVAEIVTGQGRVDGACGRPGRFGVWVLDADGGLRHIDAGDTAPDGAWSTLVPNAEPGWLIRVWCETPAGDLVRGQRRFP
jgi:hypothetical protein